MPISWKHVKYFESYEFDDPDHPGSGELIDGILLFMLDRLREDSGWPIVTHWKVGGCVDVNGTHGHSKNSLHLKKNGCLAVDFHFDCRAGLREQYYQVSKAGFPGIGVYTDWYWDGKPLVVGFHVDRRPVYSTQRWKRQAGKYIYFLP
jgi:hypothetical protein